MVIAPRQDAAQLLVCLTFDLPDPTSYQHQVQPAPKKNDAPVY